jgi:hypothetical protein
MIMRDLDEQLRRYVDSVAPAIHMNELRGEARRPRRLVPALTGAAVILAVVALVIVPGLNRSPTGTTGEGVATSSVATATTQTAMTLVVSDELLGSVTATWVNMLGLDQQDPDIWRSRLNQACTLGVWDKTVAVSLATRYIDEDIPTSVRSEAMGPPSVENAANALWLMAIQVCRDKFPDEAIAAGPPFPASQ